MARRRPGLVPMRSGRSALALLPCYFGIDLTDCTLRPKTGKGRQGRMAMRPYIPGSQTHRPPRRRMILAPKVPNRPPKRVPSLPTLIRWSKTQNPMAQRRSGPTF